MPNAEFRILSAPVEKTKTYNLQSSNLLFANLQCSNLQSVNFQSVLTLHIFNEFLSVSYVWS